MPFVLNRVKLYKTTFIFDRGIGGGYKITQRNDLIFPLLFSCGRAMRVRICLMLCLRLRVQECPIMILYRSLLLMLLWQMCVSNNENADTAPRQPLKPFHKYLCMFGFPHNRQTRLQLQNHYQCNFLRHAPFRFAARFSNQLICL